jgi:hypothetical protein
MKKAIVALARRLAVIMHRMECPLSPLAGLDARSKMKETAHWGNLNNFRSTRQTWRN